MKKYITLFSLVIVTSIFSQRQITLEEAIDIAQEKSPDYNALVNRNQGRYWRFRNFQAGFLPQLRFDATLPQYRNSVNRITLDDGSDAFRRTNQTRIQGNLSLNQNIALTGGTISVSSQIERVDISEPLVATNFAVIPFSINYSQNSLFFNRFKWDKKIEPLVYEEAKREFIERMESIASNTARRYFDLLKSQVQKRIAISNYSNQDTLFQISKGRYKMGKIAENDLLQLELSVLNAENGVITNEIDFKRTSQNLARYLVLDTEDIILQVPKELPIFSVTVEKALKEARSNRSAVIQFRRRRLQAERNVAQVKGDYRLSMGIRANFGISQQGNQFNNLFQDFNQQQSVSLSLGVPIVDWGVSKSRRKLAEADKDLVYTNIEIEEEGFEQEIYLHVLNWQNQRNFLKTSKKAQEIALKRYNIAKKRFVQGKINITDLNIALQEQDRSVLNYLNSLEKFWRDYYTLRRLTLYDFIKDRKIAIRDIIYD